MKKVSPTGSKERIGYFITRWGSLITSLIIFILSVGLYFFSFQTKKEIYVPYLVANRDILPLEEIKPSDISLYSFPEKAQPPKGIRESDAAKVIGQKTLITVRKGDLFSPSFFGVQDIGKGNNIAAVIPKEMRLMYLNASDFHTLPPDLQKKNKIDIYAIPESDEANSELAARILTGIEVFDVITGKTDTGEGVVLIGLLLNDTQTKQLNSYLTTDWSLQSVLRPQNEQIENIEDDETPKATPSARPQ